MIASLPKAINSLLRFSQNVIGFKEVILIIEEATSKIKVISSLDALMEKSSALTKISKDAFKQQLAIDSQTKLTLLGIPLKGKTPENNYQQQFEWVLREIEQLLIEARSLKSQRLEYSQSGIFVENLIKNMNEGVIVFDHQNVITHLNNAAHQFLDINKKVQNQMDFVFYDGNNSEPIPADLTPSTIALSGGVIHNKIYTLYSEAYPEGGFVKVNANPIRNKDNEIIAAAVTLTNFTSVLKQEEEIKKQRDLLRQASTMAEVGYWELDLATSEVFWSEITRKIHETPEGFHPTLEEGINFYDEASRPIITETINQSIKTGNGWDIELKIITATNKRKWVRSIAECYTQNGVVTKIAGVFQDISESKNREAQILESKSQTESLNALLSADIQQKKQELITTKERYSILYNNAPDMMASIDVASKKIIDCNEQTAKMLGYDKSELMGMPLFNVYHEDSHEKAKKTFAFFKKTGKVNDVRLQLTKKNGDKLNVMLNASAIRDEKGTIVQTNSVWRDITDLVATEEKLQQLNSELEERVEERTNELIAANNELEDFTYMATHDLKAPIANVMGHIGIIKAELGVVDNKIINECLKWIDNSLNLAENKIHSIVRVAQLQFQDINQSETIDVKNEIEAIISDMNLYILENKASITFENTASFKVNYIKENFKSIFSNLIHNAIKYKKLDAPPQLFFRIDSTASMPSVALRDNGIGFDAEHQKDKIFGMFKRLHDHVEGDGMGLHLVKKIIDKAGGEITVSSEVNKGTTFKIFFKR